MTEQLDLEAIEARANAATSGPWHMSNTGGDSVWGNPPRALLIFDAPAQKRTDAEFSAAARTDVPALIAEVRRLRYEFAVGQQQGTVCAGCGVFKHTPVRRDSMGGYVCGGCLERELDRLRDELHETSRDTQGLAEENDSLRAELDQAQASNKRLLGIAQEIEREQSEDNAAHGELVASLRAEAAARTQRGCQCTSEEMASLRAEVADLRRVVAELDEDGRMHTEMIRGMAIELGELKKRDPERKCAYSNEPYITRCDKPYHEHLPSPAMACLHAFVEPEAP